MKFFSYLWQGSIKLWRRFLHLPFLAKIIVIMFLAGLVWFAFTRMESNKQQPRYQTADVEKGTLVVTVSASGNVLTTNTVTITTQATGVVKALYVKDGDTVSAGQKIAEVVLDREGQQKNASAWSSYLSAKNTVDAAYATAYTLRSAKDTAWKKFYDLAINSTYQNSDGTPRDDIRTSSAEFQSLQADWLAAEAKYKNQQAVIDQANAGMNNAWLSYQLSSHVISALMAGVVTNVVVVPGMVLSTSDSSHKVAVIQSETQPIISVNLTEADVPKVKIDQKLTIAFDGLPDTTFTGNVVAVDRIGTITSNVTNYPALIRLDSASSDVLPNMTANASIILDTKAGVLLVPSSAIQGHEDKQYIRILKNGRPEQVPVEVGLSNDTQTEIISGVSEGDEVIIGTLNNKLQQRSDTSVFGGGAFRVGGMRR